MKSLLRMHALLLAFASIDCMMCATTALPIKMKSPNASALVLVFLVTTVLNCKDNVAADEGVEQELSAALTAKLPQELIDYRPPECPCIRYTPWSGLTNDQKGYASNLGYNKNSWNHHRQSYNALEDLYWPALSAEQQGNATRLGYDHHRWTCCANHYEWHHWGHMGNWWPEAQMAYSILGYNKAGWNRDFDYPPSAFKNWCRNVTGEQEDVCFTELELFALKTVCFGSESVYRYDSLARPIWGGKYFKPDHCAAEDEKRGTVDNDQDNANDDEKIMETARPTRSPSITPTPGPTMIPSSTPTPTKETFEPTGEPTSVGEITGEDEGGSQMTSGSSATGTSYFVLSTLLWALAGSTGVLLTL